MALQSIEIDSEDFCFGTLKVIEQSFGVPIPDTPEWETAGDLFDIIIAGANLSGDGDRCDSAMVFYRLRRVLAREHPGARVDTATRLSDLGLGSPKSFGKRITRETGLQMPVHEISGGGCLLSLALIALAIGGWWFDNLLVCAAGGLGSWMPLIMDRGGWTGAWRTVGSLAQAITRSNVAKLSAMGARNRPEDWWRRFAEILADDAQPIKGEQRPLMSRRIGRETRVRLV